MPQFQYQIKNAMGYKTIIYLECDSLSQAKDRLVEHKVSYTNLRPVNRFRKQWIKLCSNYLPYRKKTLKTILIFLRNQIASGVSLERSFELISLHVKSKRIQHSLMNVRHALSISVTVTTP